MMQLDFECINNNLSNIIQDDSKYADIVQNYDVDERYAKELINSKNNQSSHYPTIVGKLDEFRPIDKIHPAQNVDQN